MQRRTFLRGAAAAAALALVPARRAFAGAWAEPPDAVAGSLLLPSGTRAERVLEVFLQGGLGPFETFYVVEANGRPDDTRFPNEQWHLFREQHGDVFGACGLGREVVPFGTDALGQRVGLGPALAPLIARPDLLARMRILVQRHDVEPHEAAIPLALSGLRLGSARLAGTGAAVQRYFRERDPDRRAPFSYVIYPPESDLPTHQLAAASAVGLHPGSARPLDLRIRVGEDLAAQLARTAVGDHRRAHDALVAHYSEQAARRYRRDDEALRSRALTDHAFAASVLADADALRDLLGDDALATVPNEACGVEVEGDPTAMALRLATHLLTHPGQPARHVTVVDGGMVSADGGGGYDVHEDHLRHTTRNLYAMLRSLAASVNEPNERNPAKIDLDATLIVLNTEFGRTPYAQGGTAAGTNHHPYGYVTVLIGGPIEAEQRGIVGAIGPDGWADRYVTPTESRAAVLAAMGIWPFTPQSFAVGDLRDVASERDALAWLDEIVLGRPS